jgi:hypothetical protein
MSSTPTLARKLLYQSRTTIRRSKITTRKHAFYGFLALVSLLGLGITPSARANLITNGSFEDRGGFLGWSISGNIGAGGNAHTGNLAAISNFGSIAQNVTTPGTSYVVDFWLATNIGPLPNTNASVNVLWGGTTIFSHLFSSSQGYTQYTFTVPASSATTALEFQFSSGTLFAKVFLDDVSINPAGVPDGGSA